MKPIVLKAAAAAAAMTVLLGALPARAGQADLGISIGDGRLRSFYIAVGDHYRVAPRVVVDYRTRYRLGDEDLPVLFFLAARAQVGPQAVIDLRLKKLSWLQIALHFGLSPEIFFVPVGLERIGPPYGNAYGYYRKHGRGGDWRQFSLQDREVVDLVNLRFLSEYHGVAPDEIIALRGQGRSFVAIHEEAGRGKAKDAQAGKPRGGKPPKGHRK
jgi:hypothetical protein